MFKEYCNKKIILIDSALTDYFTKCCAISPKITEAMEYSVFAGGKRLRPILLMAAADAVGQNGEKYINMACGLEMIHTYSLIHDDLPAMDNDDYRRGKLTNHKVFGEGIAILAGDGLLTAAFEMMLSQTGVKPETLLQVVREISTAAGACGMVGGQALDLISEGKTIDSETVTLMHKAKTGALFKAAIRAGAILAGGTDKQVHKLSEFAEQFGLAFQITDDILDVTGTQDKIGKPVGSDIRNQKATYVTLYSLEEAQDMAKAAVQKALDAIESFGDNAQFLQDVVKYLIIRDN